MRKTGQTVLLKGNFIFSGEGVAIKVLVEKGKNITGKDYKDI